MAKFKIEFYSPLLERWITKWVDNPKDYKGAIIVEHIEDNQKIEKEGI